MPAVRPRLIKALKRNRLAIRKLPAALWLSSCFRNEETALCWGESTMRIKPVLQFMPLVLLWGCSQQNPATVQAAEPAAMGRFEQAAVPQSNGPTRLEHDLLGEKNVPASAYYGVQTARALENFQI